MSNKQTKILFQYKTLLDVMRIIGKCSIELEAQYVVTFVKYRSKNGKEDTKKSALVPNLRISWYSRFVCLYYWEVIFPELIENLITVTTIRRLVV